jgi:hypothetical protein
MSSAGDKTADDAAKIALVSYVPQDDSDAGGAIGRFFEAVRERYEEAFGDKLTLILHRDPPPWGEHDHWGEALRQGAPLMAVVSPRFADDDDRVSEVVALSGGGLEDPAGRVILIPWERGTETEPDPALPTLAGVNEASEDYANAAKRTAFWLRGVMDSVGAPSPEGAGGPERDARDVEVVEDLEAHAPRMAYAARQYRRLEREVMRHAEQMDDIVAVIFDGLEETLGHEWTNVWADGAAELAQRLEEPQRQVRIEAKEMLDAWKEARTSLRTLYYLADECGNHSFRDQMAYELRGLVAELDMSIDATTLAELQFGCDTRSPLRPVFKSLVRGARTRTRIRGAALACLVAIGEVIPEPSGLHVWG